MAQNPPPVTAYTPGPSRLSRLARKVRNLLILALVLAVAVLALYLFVASRWSYSSGERAGYVQKFSRKGWVCKTWEGEIAMANLPGAMPSLFAFTVRDDAVAAQINAQLGARVVLKYEQHLGLPSCFGETEYWVTGAHRAEP
ncbi:MAG TPA: hypothetical protein VL691_07020 [Vicinamibacteria bacterium]|nr:hypothetical protein [Vicinamibacteria bacterium]